MSVERISDKELHSIGTMQMHDTMLQLYLGLLAERSKVTELQNAMFENVRNYAWDNIELRERITELETKLATAAEGTK